MSKNKKSIAKYTVITLVALVTSGLIGFGGYYAWKKYHRSGKRKVISHNEESQDNWPKSDLQAGKPFSKGYDGIDISVHQGSIRWNLLCSTKSNKPKFIYIRAMGRSGKRDPKYKQNLIQAQKNNIPVGSYLFYSHFMPVGEQFRTFVSMVSKGSQNLCPVIDVEKESIKRRVGTAHLKDSVMLLAKMMERHYGKKPIIYSNQNFYRRHLSPFFDNYPLWIANYRRQPVCREAKPILWQYSETGHIHGINTTVDLNRFINGGSIHSLMLR